MILIVDFQSDVDKFATFAARRLGYPIVDIELQSGSFYTAFEEAITTYGNEMFAYQACSKFLIISRSFNQMDQLILIYLNLI